MLPINFKIMEISAQFIVLVPIVLGVVQVLKVSGLPSRWSPLLSLLLGVVGATLLIGGELRADILQGLAVGLSASGLWSGVKALATPTPDEDLG